MGLKAFLVDDSGEEIAIPQHYRKAEKHLKRLQRLLSRKKKGSNRRKEAIKRIAKAHLKVANQRKDFHYKTAKKLLSQGKHVAHEKLNIKGIACDRGESKRYFSRLLKLRSPASVSDFGQVFDNSLRICVRAASLQENRLRLNMGQTKLFVPLQYQEAFRYFIDRTQQGSKNRGIIHALFVFKEAVEHHGLIGSAAIAGRQGVEDGGINQALNRLTNRGKSWNSSDWSKFCRAGAQARASSAMVSPAMRSNTPWGM